MYNVHVVPGVYVGLGREARVPHSCTRSTGEGCGVREEYWGDENTVLERCH